MTAQIPDDKIQAMVGLVLQAVDQRLGSVREQLVQLSNNIARSHADLESQIDEVRQLCMATAESSGSFPPGADAAAARQLVDAANVLTDRVTFLEARVNQYTNDRVAELHSAIERLNHQLGSGAPATSSPALSPSAVNATPNNPAPARSVIVAPVTSTPNPSPSVFTTTQPFDDRQNVAPAAARLVPLGATPKQQAERPVETIDIEQLSAQMSERLSAAIERALGT